MQKELVNKSEIKLVGLKTRTNNKNEMNIETAKIGALAQRFWQQNIASQIQNRKTPGTTFAVYTEYDSDEHDDYTYFIGEEVNRFENIPQSLEQLVIPANTYQKFTTASGNMPKVVIEAWQQIWLMTPTELGGQRNYIADFEVYDERAHDPAQTSVDIFIGIKT